MPNMDLNQLKLAGGKMFIEEFLSDKTFVAIIVRQYTAERLRTKCFRGKHLKLAGNFSRWESAEGLFQDGLVLDQFLDELDSLWERQDFGTHSLCITHTQAVGWESTDLNSKFESEDLEPFTLNRKSHGLRVKRDRTDILAPETNELTLVFELKYEEDRLAVIVHSVYPGLDIGELVGDVTEREKRVFFDWGHPGK